MRIAKRHISVVLCLLLLGAGCAGGGGSKEEGGTASPASKPGVNDINPTDRDELADGQKLTWPIDTFPSNFNLHELDGALADGAAIMGAQMPGMFNFDAEAAPVVNTDYAESAVLTATEPKQVVTYKLNPKATWDDGKPITVADFEAQWKALNGKDDRFRIASSSGYEKIESVAKGADDKEIIVTYASPFVDWQGLFSPLYPASTNRDPAIFNDGGSRRRSPPPARSRWPASTRPARPSPWPATRSGGESRPSSIRSSSARSTVTPSLTPWPTARSTSWASAPTSPG